MFRIICRRTSQRWARTLLLGAILMVPSWGIEDSCSVDSQCLNGGTCIDVHVANSQTILHECDCQEGYSGTRCENYCPLQCQHGGICHASDQAGNEVVTGASSSSLSSSSEKYQCKCLGYFQGDLCQTPYQNCDGGWRCLNGGLCNTVQEDDEQDADLEQCQCPPDWVGSACDLPLADYSGMEDESWMARPPYEWWIGGCMTGGLLAAFLCSFRWSWRYRRWRYRAASRKAFNRRYHDRVEQQDGLFRDVPPHPKEIALSTRKMSTTKTAQSAEYMNVI